VGEVVAAGRVLIAGAGDACAELRVVFAEVGEEVRVVADVLGRIRAEAGVEELDRVIEQPLSEGEAGVVCGSQCPGDDEGGVVAGERAEVFRLELVAEAEASWLMCSFSAQSVAVAVAATSFGSWMLVIGGGCPSR
jgi:hypothetical protein